MLDRTREVRQEEDKYAKKTKIFELSKIDINTLTPIEALMKLNAIKKMIGR